MENIKGAIFDLDGTILDSMNVWKKVDEKFFVSEGMTTPKGYMQEIAAMNIYDIAVFTINKYHVKYEPDQLVAKWLDMAKDEYVNNVLVKPYVKEYLKKLKNENVKLGIATALDSSLYIPCLKRNGILEYFDVLANLTDLNSGKDNPEIYLTVASNLGVKPSECLVFEDILTCISTAKKAGFITVGVNEMNNENIKSCCDKYIYSFKELL